MTLPQDIAKLMGGTVVLVQIPYYEESDKHMLPHIKDHTLRDLLHFLRTMQLCGSCIKTYGYEQRFEDLLPKPTPEQLEAFLPVGMALDPLLQELAEKKEHQL